MLPDCKVAYDPATQMPQGTPKSWDPNNRTSHARKLLEKDKGRKKRQLEGRRAGGQEERQENRGTLN